MHPLNLGWFVQNRFNTSRTSTSVFVFKLVKHDSQPGLTSFPQQRNKAEQREQKPRLGLHQLVKELLFL